MSEEAKKPKRYVVSLQPEAEDLIKQIQEMLKKDMPKNLGRIKVSKSMAVETAIKAYLEKTGEDF